MDFPSHVEKNMSPYSVDDIYNSENKQYNNAPLREQDRFLPIANIARIMKKSIPQCGKIAKDAKECVQECVSEFISFITSEASDKCQLEKRKTINGDDIIYAMGVLGFDSYIEPLKTYLYKYRDSLKTNEKVSQINTDLDSAYASQQLRLSDLGTQILMGKISLTLNSLNNIESPIVSQLSENLPHSGSNNGSTYLNATNFNYNQTLPSIMEMTSMTPQVQNLQSPANGINLIDGSDSNGYDISHSDNHDQNYDLVDFHSSDNSSYNQILTNNHLGPSVKKHRKI